VVGVFKKIYYLIKNCRFHEGGMIHFLIMVAFGFFSSCSFIFNFDIFFILIITLLMLGVNFQFNNAYDSDVDKYSRIKKKYNLVSMGLITKKDSIIFGILMAIFVLFLAFRINIVSFLIVLSIIIMGFFYSCPPIRLKKIPILELIIHGIFYGSLLVFLGAAYNNIYNLETFTLAFIFFFISIILQLSNHYVDYESDKRGNVMTTAIFLGKKQTIKLMRVLLFFVFALSVIFYLINFIRLIHLIFFIFYIGCNIILWRKFILKR